MDNVFLRYLYSKQTTKWIWLFGITSAIVLTIQYNELPIFSGLSFLLSGAKASFLQKSYVRSHDVKDSYLGFNKSIIHNKAPPRDVDKEKPKMETLQVMSISEMNELLQKSHDLTHSVVCI